MNYNNTGQGDVSITTQIQRIAKRNIVVGQSNYLNLWQSYYQNDYSNLNYTVETGNKTVVRCRKKCLGMPKKVCKDMAKKVLTEKCRIAIPNKAQEVLDRLLKESRFWSNANKNYEQAMALGIGAWVEGIDGMEVDKDGRLVNRKGKIKIRFINATKVYPITITDGIITECAFVSNQTTHYNVEIHLLHDGTEEGKESLKGTYYVRTCQMSNDYATILSDFQDFETGSNIPLFQLVYPNESNNLNLNSNLPVSMFANSLDTFESIDEKYDDFDTEFKNGKKRIFVNANLWKVDQENGETIRSFDPNDTVFYSLEFEDNTKPLIETSADPLRDESYIRAMNAELNLLSAQLGFGRNVYNIQELTETSKTATEVKHMNNELMDTVARYQLVVEDALIGLVKAVQYLSNTFTDERMGNFTEDDIKVMFDDSVFEDKETEQRRDKENVESSLMSIVEYRMKWMGETEEDARAYVYKFLRHKLINDNLQALTGGAMPPEVFVDICYGDKTEEEKLKLVEFINEKQKQSNVVWNDFENEEQEGTE